MKPINYFSAISILLLFLTSCEQKHNLIAELEGMENDTILVEYGTISDFFSGDQPKRDTVYANKGKFTYDIPSQEPYFVYFHPKSSVFTRLSGHPYFANQNYIVTFIAPNDKIKVSGKLNKYYVSYNSTGSAFNKDYSTLRNSYIQKSSKGAEIELKLDTLNSTKGDKNEINALFKKRNEFNGIAKTKKLEYIKNNLGKDLSAYFLTRQRLDTIAKYYNKLHVNVREGIFKEALNNRLLRHKKYTMVREAEKNIVEGKIATDFSLKSLSGSDFTLSSIKDKYVVLDFWGSWCPPCINGIPKMKDYYSKYKDKVEFIGIACNDTEEIWKETVKKHNLKWLQLFNNKGLEKDVSVKFGIQNYPTKIILDKEKRILGIFIGESEEFYSALDKILK